MGEQSFKVEHRYASRESESEREHAERVAEQFAGMPNVTSLATLSGVSSEEAIAALASLVASKKQIAKRRDHIIDFYTMDDTIDIANTIRDQNVQEIDVIAALVRRNANNERAIESLRRDLADIRAAQSLADPAGGHPYRSSPATFGRSAEEAPSRPVATSAQSPTPTSAASDWRRAYGALRWRVADACMALVPILAGVSVYLGCSAGGADTIGVVLGMGVTGLGSVPTLTWWRT